jgi:glycosyltransferase involved in cell wall biosynthesis
MSRPAQSALFNLTFLDVSQFASEPLRTGVQRVLIKVIEHLPRDRIMPFRVFDETRVAILDPAIFEFAIRHFRQSLPGERALVSQVHGRTHRSSQEELLIRLVAARPLAILPAAWFFEMSERIINLEAFSSPVRSRLYASCRPEHRGKIFHFVHDLLLFEAPEVFPQLNWRYASDYVLLFEAYCAAGGFFVASEQLAARLAFHLRRPATDMRVVHFGGDFATKMPPPPRGRGTRRSVVVLGTIEPRKYPRTVIDALFRIAAYHPDVDCILIGKWGWVDAETRAYVEDVLATGRITHYADLTDADVTRIMQAADVGIYVSSNEGFGLPVVEFAALGVPVVTNVAVPAAALVGCEHASVLQTVELQGLVTQVERLLAAGRPEQGYYQWRWADCAREIFAWRRSAPRTGDGDSDVSACWQHCARLIGELHGRYSDTESVRQAALQRLHADTRLWREISRDGKTPIAPAQMRPLMEAMSDIVAENHQLIQWTDLLQARDALVELTLALCETNILEALGRAYVAFLGRPLDVWAACQAVGMKHAGDLFARLIELINSEEAARHLGAPSASVLRHLVGAVSEIIHLCLSEHLDLCRLNERLGIAVPTVADVILAEDLLRAGVDWAERLLYFAAARSMTGDAMDLLLEVIAGVCRARGLQIAPMEPDRAGICPSGELIVSYVEPVGG